MEALGPHPDTLRRFREAAGLSADRAAAIMGVSQPTYSRMERVPRYRAPTGEEMHRLGPHIALGKPRPQEALPNWFLAWADVREKSRFHPLLEEQGKIGLFRDGSLAHQTALALAAVTLPDVFACPAWDDFTAVVMAENVEDGATFFVDEDIGGRHSRAKRVLSKRARAMEHAASILRRLVAEATRAELAAAARAT